MKNILILIIEIIALLLVIPITIAIVLGVRTLIIWGIFSGIIYLFGLSFTWGIWKSFILACILSLIKMFCKLFFSGK